jgi:hypothetical protein
MYVSYMSFFLGCDRSHPSVSRSLTGGHYTTLTGGHYTTSSSWIESSTVTVKMLTCELRANRPQKSASVQFNIAIVPTRMYGCSDRCKICGAYCRELLDRVAGKWK